MAMGTNSWPCMGTKSDVIIILTASFWRANMTRKDEIKQQKEWMKTHKITILPKALAEDKARTRLKRKRRSVRGKLK